MLQLIPYAIAAAVGGLLGKKIYPFLAQQYTGNGAVQAGEAPPPVQFFRESVLDETPIILATEDIPLDNRFGNQMLVSEHEFSRTATIGLTLGKSHGGASQVSSSLWSIVQTLAQEEIQKSLKVEFGTQISRRVKIVFSADPGHLVRYRVVWKQESRRGVFDVQIGGETTTIPYVVAFGLSHAIESVAGSSRV
jgi:hypothetical protein